MVRHESRRCKFVKMLKRRAASYGVYLEIRGPQNKGKKNLINKIGGSPMV